MDVIDLLWNTEVFTWGESDEQLLPPHVIISRLTGWLNMSTRYIITVLN